MNAIDFRTRLAFCALAFVAVASFTAVRTVKHLNVPGDPQSPSYGLQDFRDAIYFPVVALLDGHNPYDVRDYLSRYPVGNKFPLYAPMALGLYLPFGLASQDHAGFAFLALNVPLTLVLAYCALRIGGASPDMPAVLGVGALLLASHPGHMSAFIGQATTYVVTGVYLAFLYARRRPWAAAFALALACLKPTFGVPAALLLLARGDVGVVMRGAVVAAAASAVVSVALVRAAGGLAAFVGSLWGNYALWNQTFVSSAESVFRIDALAFVGRLLRRNLTAPEDLVITTTILGLGALAVHRVARAQAERGDVLVTCVAATTILAATYHQVYDALILAALAVALAATNVWRGFERVALAVLIAVPAVNYVATDSFVERFDVKGAAWVAIGSMNGAALLIATGMVLWTALRRP